MLKGMRKKAVCFFPLVLVLGARWLLAQGPVYKPGEYPAPRYPQIKKNITVEDLMPAARTLVRTPYQSAFLEAGYNIQKGQKALLVATEDTDQVVLDALVRAIREAGGEVDVVKTFGPLPTSTTPPIFNAAREALGITDDVPVDADGQPIRRDPRGFTQRTIMQLAENGGYNVLIQGSGGPHPALKIPWQRLFWDKADKFITSAGFPVEIQNTVDQIVWDTVTQARKFHAVDPEGTDITWTVKPNYWEEGKDTFKKSTGDPGFNIVHQGHIGLIPTGMSPESFQAEDAAGVIAGTSNHAGPFPHIRVSYSKGSAIGVEGGGEYGKRWQAALAKWASIQWPDAPRPGINMLWEAALGTNPKSIRAKDYAENGGSWERTRSGVVHWGTGARGDNVYLVQMPEAIKKFQLENSVPHGHVHIHNYFLTLDMETLDGKTVRLINKGRLTALDDPRVRQVAAKYGNPDELLREIWIPSMPGINVPGDYFKDYAGDPASYDRKDMAEHYQY